MGQTFRKPTADDFEFPDDATPQEIDSFLKKQAPIKVDAPPPKSHTWSDRLGLNEPTESMVGGFLRGSGAAAVDMAQGAASEVSQMMQDKLATENANGGPLARPDSIPERQMPEALKTEAPQTTAGTIGTYAPTVAGMAVPVGGAAKAAVNAYPRLSRAGEKFKDVMGAAKDMTLDMAAPGDAAVRIMTLAEHGGTLPITVGKFLRYATDPKQPPMTYEVARDFASNISRLSADEMGRLTPVMRREVAHLRVALNKSIADVAKKAGKGEDYAAAMREYANAMRLRGMSDAMIKGAKKAAPLATAAGLGYWLTNKVRNAVGGE